MQRTGDRHGASIHENVNVKKLTITINVKITADFKSLKWVKDLVKIKMLKSLTLQAEQHDLNSSSAMILASYKEGSLLATVDCFSKHLVPFFEYLRHEMLERPLPPSSGHQSR